MVAVRFGRLFEGGCTFEFMVGFGLARLKKIMPVAILCSHAATVVDLCLCYPLLTPSDENLGHEKDLGVDSSTNDQAALVSACSDGVLCLWSRGSGHCRRRRKLPPWAGSPSMVKMLPSNRRYLCVASCFSDGLHASDHECLDYAEGNEVTGDQESFCKKATKCTIVIVDSYTLTIVQTVFHGNLSIGPLKYMTITDPVDEKDKSSTLIVDSQGNIQLIPLVQDSNLDKEGETKLHSESARMNTATLDKGSCEGGLVVYVTSCGLILGLIYETQCVIMLLPSSMVIGVIPFENIHGTLSHVVGGMFISSDISCGSQPGKIQSSFDIDFVVWDERGFAVVYKISFAHNTFKYEVIYEIPARVYPFDVKISTNFVQLGCYFLRVESLCLNYEEPLLWRPRFTIWSLHQQLDGHENIANTCKLLGESDFLINGIYEPYLVLESEASELILCEKATAREGALTSNNCAPGQEEDITLYKDDLKCISVKKEHIVSSSMVISQNVCYPYAIVYGYHNGDIELVQLNVLTQKPDDGVTLNPDMNSVGSKQLLSGHTGAVLCLAAHQMVVTTNDQSYRKVLLSGSMDCTLRVWDLDTGSPIMVMHHHVAAVRQIVLPPFQSDHPWDDCFLSVGEDSCVALVSLSTLRAERMFPGHPSYPGQVIWDCVRGYLACLSQNNSVASSAKDVLYIWDIKAGSRERVLRGTAAHSMFSNFCKGMNINNISGCSYNTSNTSFDLPLTEDGSSLPTKLKSSLANSVNEVNGLDHGNHSLSRGDKCVKLTPGNHDKVPIRCYCPNSGITILSFDLSSLVSVDVSGEQWLGPANDSGKVSSPSSITVANYSSEQGTLHESTKQSRMISVLTHLSYACCDLVYRFCICGGWTVNLTTC